MRWPVLQCGGFLLAVALCLWIALSPRAEDGESAPVAASAPRETNPEPKARPAATPRETNPEPKAKQAAPAEIDPEPKARPVKGGEKKPGKDVRGVVKSVDLADRTAVLTVKDKGKESEATFPVAVDARVRRGGRELSLADVKPGMSVRAVLGDGDSVVELRLEGKDN